MAGEITRTVLAEISKYIQIAPLVSAYNDESVLFDLIKAEARNLDIGGRTSGWLAPSRKVRANGFYSRAEAGTIGQGIPADYGEQIVPVRYLYVPISITGPAEEFGRGKANALVDAVAEGMETANNAMARNISRAMWGNGSGQLALINGSFSSVTGLTLDSPGTQYLDDGMILDIGSSLLAATISTVDSDTTITTSAAVDTADNDIVYIDGNKDIEPMGLGGIMYDGTTTLWDCAATTSINGLTRSTNTWTYANGCTAAGNTVTMNLLKAISNSRKKGGAKKSDKRIVVCSPGVKNSVYYTAQNKINYIVPTSVAGGAPSFSLGAQDFSFNGIRVVDDPQAPETATTGPAVVLNLEYLEQYWTRPPHLDDEGWLPGGATSDSKSTKLIVYMSGIVCRSYRAQAYVPAITINNSSAA